MALSNGSFGSINPITVTASGSGYSVTNVTANQSIYTGHGSGAAVWSTSNPQYTSNIALSGTKGEVVRLNPDGTVTWANGIKVDEAAEAFAKSITVGAELAAGLTESVKKQMRDTLFEEIIEIAKEDGPLSAEQLTFMHKSSKIMDKLKGKI